MAKSVLEELIVVLGYDYEDEGVQQFVRGIDRAKSVTRGLVSAVKTAAVGIGVALLGIGAAGIAVGKNVFGVGKQFEKLKVQLNALEGSAEAGQKAMDWITEFAKKTPLELDQVVAAYVKLRSFGMDPTNGSLQTLMDTMAATGKGAEALDGIILAMGQAWTKSRLMGDDALQLLGRGVPVYDILAEKMGKTTAEIMKMQSAGKLGRDAIELLIEGLKDRYAGAADEFAKTSEGIESNLADIFTLFRKKIADAGFYDAVKGKLQGLLDEVNRLDESGRLDEIAKTISDTLVRGLETVSNIIANIQVDDVASAFETLVSLGVALIDIVQGVAGSVVWMVDSVQLLTGFFGLILTDGQAILTVIGLIVAAFFPWIAVVGVLIAAVQDLWAYFSGGESVIGGVIEWISALIQVIAHDIEQLGSAISSSIESGFANAVASVKAMWDGMLAWLKAKWDAFWGPISSGIGWLKGKFGGQMPGDAGDMSGEGFLPGSPPGAPPPAVPPAATNSGVVGQFGPVKPDTVAQGPIQQNSNNNTQNTANVNITQNITEAQAPGAAGKAVAKATTEAAFQSASTTAPEAAY
ncbi:MAG: tape measure protein [Nitratireductor sp.]|nr:tape measure protein [Nitratireductor sp.]